MSELSWADVALFCGLVSIDVLFMEGALMTELSPQAQAVLDAVLTDNLTGPERFWARAHAAAALRAAADRTEADSIWGGHLEHTGVQWAAEQWRIIAAELECGTSTRSTH